LNIQCFDETNFYSLCDHLAWRDIHLKNIIQTYSYPPFWNRTPTFATLVHIILEQQVSLASAKAAFLKLQEKIGHITPEYLLQLTDEEMKACYFSRQKIIYAKALASSIVSGDLIIEQLNELDDDSIINKLQKIKGIGNWTTDVFLMMALHRCDCFPTGDIALIKSIKEVKDLPPATSREEILSIANHWKPYRTIAAYLLWHSYIKKRNIKF
jgi:DNA-3-methyladenine glycosylase II